MSLQIKNTIIVACLVFPLYVFSQIDQVGYTKEYIGSAPKQIIGGVEIMAEGASSTISAVKDGTFTLHFNDYEDGDRLIFIDGFPYLNGYEVFNREVVSEWNLSGKHPLNIVLCKRSYLAQKTDSLTNTMRVYYKQQLERKETQLNNALQQNQIQHEEYEKQLQTIKKEYVESLQNLQNYVDQFVHFDLSEINNEELEIISLINSNRIDEALAKYDDLHLLDKLLTAKQNMKKAEEGIQILKQEYETNERASDTLGDAINRQITALKLKGGKESYDKIEKILVTLAECDTTDLDATRDCALFFYDQNEIKKAEQYSARYFRNCQEFVFTDYNLYTEYLNLLLAQGRNNESDALFQRILSVVENQPSGSQYVYCLLYLYKLWSLFSDNSTIFQEQSEDMLAAYINPPEKVKKRFAKFGMEAYLPFTEKLALFYSFLIKEDFKQASLIINDLVSLYDLLPTNNSLVFDEGFIEQAKLFTAFLSFIDQDTTITFDLLRQSETSIRKLYDRNPIKYGSLLENCLYTTATIYGSYENTQMCYSYLQKAFDVAQFIHLEQNNEIQYAKILSMLCVTSSIVNDTTTLYSYIDDALKWVETIQPLPKDMRWNYSYLMNLKGVYCFLHDDKTSGYAYILRAYDLLPTNEDARNNLVYYYNNEAYEMMNIGKLDSSFVLIDKALELLPNNPNLLDSKGEFYIRKGDFTSAVQMWNEIIKVDPNFLDAYPNGTELYNQLMTKQLIP